MSKKEQQKDTKSTKKIISKEEEKNTAKKVTAKRVPKKTIAVQTAEFLLANPDFLSDFLQQNEEIVSQIQFAHQAKGAISLHGKQLQLLHDKNLVLDEQMQQMQQIAHTNVQLFHQTTSLVLQLIAAKNLKELQSILLHYFGQLAKREDCYCLQLDEDLEQKLKEKCPHLFLAFKIENKATIFADFNCDELFFLLQKTFIHDVFDPTFHDAEDEQTLAKTLPVLVAPLKKDEQIIGLFSVPLFEQKQADPTQGTLFFDFLVQVLNVICLQLLKSNKQKPNEQQIMWQEMFEACVAKLVSFAPILLNDLMTTIFALSKDAQNSYFKCEHLTAIYNGSSTIYKNRKGLTEHNGSVVPYFVTQKLSLGQMPHSLLKKLSTYPQVIIGKLSVDEAEFLEVKPDQAKSALIMPIWQQNELVALFYWTNSDANFYSKKNAGEYPLKIADLLQKLTPNFVRLNNTGLFLFQRNLEYKQKKFKEYFKEDEIDLSVLITEFGTHSSHEYGGFKCAEYFCYSHPYEFGFHDSPNSNCPDFITTKLEIPSSLQNQIAHHPRFIINELDAELSEFLFPLEESELLDVSTEPLPKSAIIVPIYSNLGDLAALFCFASETPYFYYPDEQHNEFLNTIFNFYNQKLKKFIVLN